MINSPAAQAEIEKRTLACQPELSKVLCIDDDPHVSHGLQLWLYQYEVEVIHANHAE